MAAASIVYGIVVALIGVIGFAVTGAASWTALIPVIPGVVVGACGVLGLVKPGARKHAMHAAMAVALLTVLAMLHPLMGQMQAEDPDRAVLGAVLLTLAASVVYLVMGVRSFIAARRARGEQQSGQASGG